MKDQHQDNEPLPETDELKVRTLYKKLLESWNNNDAVAYAGFFAQNANVTGFDGSQMNGKKEIEKEISEIFTNHQVARYIFIIREVRLLGDGVFVLCAVAGMISPGADKINPGVNAIQTMIAVRYGDGFNMAVFQNTPAAFHGRPALKVQLTEELQNESQKIKQA